VKGEKMKYRIKELREEKRMTQEELSEKSGVSRSIISKLEQEKPVNMLTDTLSKIANALDVKVSSLFLPE
jgi:transcriptional regulator